jgi:hypothetical protein
MDLVLTYRGTVMRALFGMLGLSSAYLRDNRRALVAGDNVAVSSGVLEIKESGEVCATSRYVGVHLDAASRKSCPFPAGFAAHAKQFVRSYDF